MCSDKTVKVVLSVLSIRKNLDPVWISSIGKDPEPETRVRVSISTKNLNQVYSTIQGQSIACFG